MLTCEPRLYPGAAEQGDAPAQPGRRCAMRRSFSRQMVQDARRLILWTGLAFLVAGEHNHLDSRANVTG